MNLELLKRKENIKRFRRKNSKSNKTNKKITSKRLNIKKVYIENFIEEEIEENLFTSIGIEHTFSTDFDTLVNRVESPLIKE